MDVPDDDEAFWRRWLLIEFPNHYPPNQRELNLRDRLAELDTLSGVHNWTIDGWHGSLTRATSPAKNSMRRRNTSAGRRGDDLVDKFISEHVEHNPDTERLMTQQAHRWYAVWCQENSDDPVGQRDFTTTLKDEDVGYKSSIQIDGRCNVAMRP